MLQSFLFLLQSKYTEDDKGKGGHHLFLKLHQIDQICFLIYTRLLIYKNLTNYTVEAG